MGKVIEVDFQAKRKRPPEKTAPKKAKRIRRKGNFTGTRRKPGLRPAKSAKSFETQDGIIDRSGMRQRMLDQEKRLDYRFVGLLIIHQTPFMPKRLIRSCCRMVADHAYWYSGKPQDFMASLDRFDGGSECMRRIIWALRSSMLAQILDRLGSCHPDLQPDVTSEILQSLNRYLRSIHADVEEYRRHSQAVAIGYRLMASLPCRRWTRRLLTRLRAGVQAEFAACVEQAAILRDLAADAAEPQRRRAG